MNTSRRDRLPTGRTNLTSSREPPDTSRGNKLTPIRREEEAKVFSSTGAAVFKQLKENQLAMKDAKYTMDKAALGSYNVHSTPMASMTTPLRSVFLDPDINNITRSMTRSQLLQRVKSACVPHESYDVDGDGWVSQEDYRISKHFDLDNDGVLDAEERRVIKNVLVEEFLHENGKTLRAMGGKLKTLEETLRSTDAQNSLSLPQTFNALQKAKFSLRMSTRELIYPADTDEAGTKTQRYYTNKFDTTAWNDFDTIPRFTSAYGLEDHGGSRKRFLFSRKQKTTESCQNRLENACLSKPNIDTRRHATITNPRVENS